jgi:hypothetical protein
VACMKVKFQLFGLEPHVQPLGKIKMFLKIPLFQWPMIGGFQAVIFPPMHV